MPRACLDEPKESGCDRINRQKNGRLWRDASAKFSARSDGEDLGRTRLSLDRDRLAIVAETNTKDSRFPSESAFCPLHRFGDVRDWCSSFRMRFEFLNVFLRPRTAMRCRLLRHEQSPRYTCPEGRKVAWLRLPRKTASSTSLTCADRAKYSFVARLESAQQLRLLRGKFGLGQNAPGMQLGQPLYSSEYVFVPARRLAGRGLLLGGPLMHWFGRCLRSIHAGDGRQAAYINAAELARESERA